MRPASSGRSPSICEIAEADEPRERPDDQNDEIGDRRIFDERRRFVATLNERVDDEKDEAVDEGENADGDAESASVVVVIEAHVFSIA